MYYIGVDSGSTNCKIVLFEDKIVDTIITATTWDLSENISKVINQLLNKHSIDEENYKLVTTGYGRESIEKYDYSLTEISCHAIGGWHLNNDIIGIVDIGGQDCKIIEIENGKVISFYMNDKCAAGTGSFLSMACSKLNISLSEIDYFIKTDKYVNIASMCAVFAESEIVGLLANKVDREQILLGVIVSIAYRIDQILGKANFSENDTILLTGGLAQSKVIRDTISLITKMNIVVDDQSVLAGAIGACLYGRKKNEGV